MATRSTGATFQALGILAALAGVQSIAEVRAQPVGVEAIANYAGADRQKILEAGARREGSILLYTTGTQTRPLIDRFQQKYPYLKVELVRAGSTDVARKVLEEYRRLPEGRCVRARFARTRAAAR